MTDEQTMQPRVLGVIVCDLKNSAIGTQSRLAEQFGERTVLAEVVARLLKVRGVGEVAILAREGQVEGIWGLIGPEDRVRVGILELRPTGIDERVRIGRSWNLPAWRGGAGQWTVFDEEYHPAAIGRACAQAFDGQGADHVLTVHSHGVFLDPELTSALVEHHLHRNNEMRVTYTPAAPGLCGMVLRADIVQEMADKTVLPWQLLAYDPKAPAFDTLIREACMQVDPALSKIPNRFCADTWRSWRSCKEAGDRSPGGLAELCVQAARSVAPGMMDPVQASDWPRELEIELTARRLTCPPGSVPTGSRKARDALDIRHWVGWFNHQGDLRKSCDDLLVTFGGDGDPLLYGDGLMHAANAARAAGALSICVQTDLAGGSMDVLLAAISQGLIDIVSVTMYGHSAETYARVAGADLHSAVMRNMERLAEATRARGGVPLVVPRLLKVRETIRELEAFFDTWIDRCGWAVIDGPTDRAGSVPFAGVVDMAPPGRRACRRLWDRMLVRSDGCGAACDQDVDDKLSVGHMEKMGIQQMWKALNKLRETHASGRWSGVHPCATCREWHRA